MKNEPTSKLCITPTSMPYAPLQWHWNEKTLRTSKDLDMHLVCHVSVDVLSLFMERQSNSYRIKAHVMQCSGITVKSSKITVINDYTSSWSK